MKGRRREANCEAHYLNIDNRGTSTSVRQIVAPILALMTSVNRSVWHALEIQ